MPADRTFTAEEVDAAVAALSQEGRLDHAQDVITHAAPSLQRILNAALEEGGWFGGAHEQEVARVAAIEDPQQRVLELRTLLAEETRIGMLVGAAVGFQLARELDTTPDTPGDT
ncbi:hypothetical protein GKE82_20395 [Conexibacter sp. W3-3-2]|uniref:Uncharacterized protein n=1 Tax=Paraconexibacter algicola TaxID=2133960 RepID=A0A2T4ULU3_9ACTN|nr:MULTISPECIES: hypothetical protein [Solirubrobacterales]MTD46584.1 hypothetical protein [Conexibacter sp. W3-3-2]PTL60222.1 hypothetical protein C7Y72_11525 [Paraconexibacter algicola]